MLNEANFLESIQSILGNSSDYIAECALEDSIEIIAASPSNPLNPLGIVLPTCAPTSTVTVNVRRNSGAFRIHPLIVYHPDHSQRRNRTF